MSGRQGGFAEAKEGPFHAFIATQDASRLLGAGSPPCAGGAPAHAADPVFPVNSRIGLVAPAGFTPSTKFSGFENPQASAAILIAELPAEAYADLEKGFTDEALKARGMTVQLRQPLTFKDGKGFFVAGPVEAGGAKRHDTVMVANVGGLDHGRVGADDRGVARHADG